MASRHRIAVLPGDGIGPEVIAEAETTLQLAATLGGFEIALEHFAASWSVASASAITSGPMPSPGSTAMR